MRIDAGMDGLISGAQLSAPHADESMLHHALFTRAVTVRASGRSLSHCLCRAAGPLCLGVNCNHLVECSPECANGGTCNTVVGKCQCTGQWTGPTCEKVKKKFNFKTKREMAREEAAQAQAEAAKAPFPTAMRALLEADKSNDDEKLGAALDLLKDVVEAEPENHLAKANYGSGIARLGQKEEGLEQLQEALALQETCGESCAEQLLDTQLFRGRIFSEMGKHEESVEAFQVVADSTPVAGDERGPVRKATALMSLHDNFKKLGRSEEAAEAVEQAMDVLPDDPTIRAAWKKSQDSEEAGAQDGEAAPVETETAEKDDADEEEADKSNNE